MLSTGPLMSIMAESGQAENDVYLERPAATRDWLHHANQSLSRLRDVKKTSYSLGGGPREREVNCQCNYRSKSKSSFISLEAKPPQLALDSQETASMPDLSIPEIVKQFNERQSQKSKQMRRPHSSAIYSTKNTTRKHDFEKPSESSHNAFITVKGQTVTPQARPPHGPAVLITDVKKDDPVYKGLVYLDPQHVEQHETYRLEGLQRYSAAFCDNEDASNSTPPAPRASPELTCPRTNSPDSSEESFIDENDNYNYDVSNEISQMRSVSSAGSRSLVFAIPTASNEVTGSDDEDAQSDFKAGRLSTDYVAKSEVLLNELREKNETEAAEISGMVLDMESTKEKVSGLCISPRDLELNCDSMEKKFASSDVITPSVHLASMQINCSPVDDIRPESGWYETVWVEEPADSYVSSALPLRNSRVCSERYMSKHTNTPGRIRKHQSESSLVLQGKTVEFFNSEDLSARNRTRVIRKPLKPNDVCDEEHGKVEKRIVNEHEVTSTCLNQVATKPPLPKWITAKSSKKCTSRQKHSVDKRNVQNQPATESCLRKSNSEGNIDLCVVDTHVSATSNLSKKSVTFSQDVLNQDDQVDSSSLASFELTSRDSAEVENTSEDTLKSCLCSPPSGIVIQNGLEMNKTELEHRDMPETSPFDKASKVGHTQRTNQSTRAKVLAKVKEIPRDEDACPCRTVTRPTAALLAVSRSGESGPTETSSRNEKLLKNRSTRPSSAVIYRPPCSELTEPKSPRRKPRAMSATVQRQRTGSERGQTRPRPSSAHVGKTSSKDSRRSRAAAKVLKEGYLFKERRPLQFPPGSRERQLQREEKNKQKEENTNSLTRRPNKKELVASEECHEVFARLQEKGINVSMDTIKRGLMAPARTATDYEVPAIGSSSGLLSRPENWLTDEHARVQIWENVLSKCETANNVPSDLHEVRAEDEFVI